MTHAEDRRFMGVALGLGRRRHGQVWPNPAVGCIIVKDGRILGRGMTAVGGRPHAETLALAQAGAHARGATAYVTLEPCAHTGRTPPCANALIQAGIARVVIACSDPDPRVDGRGVAMLEGAGVKVDVGVLQAEAERDHQGFLKRITQGLPFVTLKLALTLDGRIATRTGESQWITGPAARRVVHVMRARHDAVMVGAGTVRADNPQLTVRGMGDRTQPVRVVVSTGLDLRGDAVLFTSADVAPVWLCHGPDGDPAPFTQQGCISVSVDLREGRVDPMATLRALADKGITRLFCEGGGALAASLLRAGLVDRLEVFQAGKVIGAEGVPGIGPMLQDTLAEVPRFHCIGHRQIGPDTLTSWSALTP